MKDFDKDFDYEKSRDQLAKIVEQLELKETPLQKSLELYETGKILADQCERFLTEAAEKIE
jgi:exodeoxyribonuclease VII small subunit